MKTLRGEIVSSASPVASNNSWLSKHRLPACLWGPLLFLHSAFALAVQYHVDSWTTENGLPHVAVSDLCQAPEGYLWLATLDGMVRFDGVRFVVFNRSNTPGIAGNRFTSLYCTRN